MAKQEFSSHYILGILLVFLSAATYRVSSGSISDEQHVGIPREEPLENKIEPVENVRASYKLPNLLDFERFKKVFKRSYGSILEEMARKRLFLGKAIRAFISAVSYKHGIKTSYLAINSMSDWTQAEIQTMFMGGTEAFDDLQPVVNSQGEAKNGEKREGDAGNDFIIAVDEREIKENFARIDDNLDKPGYREIKDELENAVPSHRVKRDINTRRGLNIDDLFREPVSTENIKSGDRIASNNPNYVPPELNSYGSSRESDSSRSQMPINLAEKIIAAPGISFAANVAWAFPPNQYLGTSSNVLQQPWTYNYPSYYHQPPLYTYPILPTYPPNYWSVPPAQTDWNQKAKLQQEYEKDRLERQQQAMIQKRREGQPKPQQQPASQAANDHLLDIVYIDHRTSGCLFPVRQQGRCASCYAFATMSLYEWTYCKQTGKQVPFSEQYIVDCGQKVGLKGCAGGVFSQVSDFVDKFGLELWWNFPYKEIEDQCPYKEDQNKNMGFLRVAEQHFEFIPIDQIEGPLKKMPVIVNVETSQRFVEYGGGVDELDECDVKRGHSMLLIGKGRQDGKEYWLFRNSFGSLWGEKGHYKLSVKSKCISPYGYILVGDFNGNLKKTSKDTALYPNQILEKNRQI